MKVRRLGNVLRHDYDGLQSEAIWEIVTDDLPALSIAVQRTIDVLEGRSSDPPDF